MPSGELLITIRKLAFAAGPHRRRSVAAWQRGSLSRRSIADRRSEIASRDWVRELQIKIEILWYFSDTLCMCVCKLIRVSVAIAIARCWWSRVRWQMKEEEEEGGRRHSGTAADRYSGAAVMDSGRNLNCCHTPQRTLDMRAEWVYSWVCECTHECVWGAQLTNAKRDRSRFH